MKKLKTIVTVHTHTHTLVFLNDKNNPGGDF